jgi:hypothetical protein
MSRPAKTVLIGLITGVVALLSVAGYGAVDDLNDRPKTLQHEAEIASLLENAGWVSPGLSKDKVLYMVSWQSCPPASSMSATNFLSSTPRAWIQG